MKNVYQWGLSLTLATSLGCLSPNQPSDDALNNDPDGLVAGLDLDGPEALFVQDEADPVPFGVVVGGADVLVNFVKNQDQIQPSVATRADGVSLVVFTDKSNAVSNPANPSDIKGRFIDRDGLPLGKDFFISATVTGAQDQPDVAVAPDGTFLAVWRDSSTNPARIMGRRLTFDGSSANFLTSGELVIQTVVATENLLQPAVAAVSLGAEFVVVWTRTTATDGGGIGAKRVDADGTLGASAFGIFNSAGTTQNDPDVIGSGDGNFLVAWTDANVLAASRLDVRGKRFNGSDNSGIGADFTINTGTTGSQHQAALAASDIGETYFAAWNDASDGSSTGIKGKRIVGATPDAADTAINTTTANSQAQPAVGFDTFKDAFVVAWVDASQTAPDTSSTGIRARQVLAATGQLMRANDFLLNTTFTNGQTQAALASYSFEFAQTAWADASPSNAAGFDGLGFGIRGRFQQVNAIPVASPDSYSIGEDGSFTAGVTEGFANLLANDTDLDLTDTLTTALVSGPSHASSFSLNTNGTFSYTPTTNFNGPDSFTYRINDGFDTGNTVTVNITVTAVNDAPVANNDSASTNEDTSVTFNVVGNDTDADFDSLIAVNVSGFSGAGTLTANGGGSFTFNPNGQFEALNPGQNATVTFSYQASDGSLSSANPATVTITVTGVADLNDCQRAQAGDLNLLNAQLQGCALSNSNMTGAFLFGANMTGAFLINTNLTNANLSGALLNNARLDGANLTGAILINANLTDANLVFAILNGANLSGTILNGTNLIGANLFGAFGVPTNADQATYNDTTCPDGTDSDFNNFGTCDGHFGAN